MARRRAQMSRCIAEDCNDRVSFVRTTQFSGDHPFCTKHAVCEADFYRDDDSYMAWYTIEEWNEV